MNLPCITLHRPWAEWVALGWKKIETRTHQRFAKLAGNRIGICSGLHWDQLAIDAASEFMTPEQISESYKMKANHGGALLCTALVAKHRLLTVEDSALAMIDCGTVKRFGLDLVNIQPMGSRYDVIGRQGIFYIDYPNASILREIADKNIHQRDIAQTYALTMKSGEASAGKVLIGRR